MSLSLECYMCGVFEGPADGGGYAQLAKWTCPECLTALEEAGELMDERLPPGMEEEDYKGFNDEEPDYDLDDDE